MAPEQRGLSLRLIADVARRPLWLAGLALAAAAYGLQALALAYGPLTLVAPIVAADLLFALPLAARWSRRPLRARDWGGCLLVAAGVAVFLAVAPPTVGRSYVPPGGWFLAFGIVLTIAVAAVGLGRAAGKRMRAGLLALATGVIFGLTAAVTASFTRSLRHDGFGSMFAHWQPWAMITLGLAGLALSTGAYQASSLSSSLPIIDTVEPASGVIIGAFLFDEQLATSAGGLAVQLLAAAIAVAGIAMLGPSLATMQARGQPEGLDTEAGADRDAAGGAAAPAALSAADEMPAIPAPRAARPPGTGNAGVASAVLAGRYRVQARSGGCDLLGAGHEAKSGHDARTAGARANHQRAEHTDRPARADRPARTDQAARGDAQRRGGGADRPGRRR